MFNEVTLIARLGKDPELRATQAGSSVVTLWACTSKKYNNKNTGAKEEQVQWHTIICWNQLAENVAKYTKKGSQIFVKGELQYREYERDGAKHKVAEIVAHTVQFLSSPQQSQQTAPAPQQYAAPANPYQAPPAQYPAQQQYPAPQQYQQPSNQYHPAVTAVPEFSLEEIPF